ncbi:kinteoplast poly(A) polymerase complex 1 subunit [Novymonas esmeraldas]|uniref:Kinteoplast poly(A) polymerase complex 1 subunit n=1 Tax=Novymonas esmeraldas TaxID=1808958 RepID=A0AAW0F5U6_9TRYP
MLRRCTAALKAASKLPNPGSSLLNPRSHRAKLRRAAAVAAQHAARFEEQALFAERGGGRDGPGAAVSSPSPPPPPRNARSRKQRRGHHVRRVVGRDVAERAKSMTDAEWESVSMEDKHAFTKYMSEVLREHPTEATEQQRRRYFETTMADPRDLDPNRTVRDEYERLKMGLPVQLKNPQRGLGVSQAMFDAGDASLFDPAKVDALEEAMVQVKQVFADYVRQRREGVSTEAARRKLANMLADINVETQRHLGHMFKYAEEKIRHEAREERKRQLSELQRLRRLVSRPPGQRGPTAAADVTPPPTTGDDGAGAARAAEDVSAPTPSPAELATVKRRAALKRSLGKALGLEVDVVESLITELEAQEKFMQFCEVFARLTVARGFHHGPGDETLDAYAESLRRLYSVDAARLSTLDVVQYLAAKEEAHPVEWAKRWYERLVRIPLERTPEYRRLEAIRDGDKEALELRAQTSHDAAASVSASHDAAVEAERAAAGGRTQRAVRLVEKMFMRPDDPRLKSLQERRLRYIAYLQMERQIGQARENARVFDGVEETPQAEECRRLYAQLLERKALHSSARGGEVDGSASPTTSSSERSLTTAGAAAAAAAETDTGGPDAVAVDDVNVFERDAEAAALFEQISGIVQEVIRTYSRETRRRSRAAAKAEVLARVMQQVGLTDADGSARASRAEELQRLLQEKKEKVTQRLLGVLEADVKADLTWLEAMEEAERPPLLPIPEGMSYVSAADVQAWRDVRDADAALSANPFRKNKKQFQPTLLGQPWQLPDKPLLFWGTGTRAVQQALEHAADDAERRRRGVPLAPPYPCPENPWGWRLVKDILDD